MESTGVATLLPPLQGQLQPSQDVGNCYGGAKHRRARQGQLRHLHLWWDREVELEKVLAQHRGGDEVLEVRHMFQGLSFLHMRGNANLLVHHVPAGEVVDATVDGIDWDQIWQQFSSRSRWTILLTCDLLWFKSDKVLCINQVLQVSPIGDVSD